MLEDIEKDALKGIYETCKTHKKIALFNEKYMELFDILSNKYFDNLEGYYNRKMKDICNFKTKVGFMLYHDQNLQFKLELMTTLNYLIDYYQSEICKLQTKKKIREEKYDDELQFALEM